MWLQPEVVPGRILELDRIVNYLLTHSLAKSTQKTYSRVWDQLQDFVVGVLGVPCLLPVNVRIVSQYVAYLYTDGKAYSTILTALSVVAFAHRVRGLESPTDLFLIKKLLAGVKMNAYVPDKRRPILLHLLEQMLEVVDNVVPVSYNRILVKAILAVMFAGGFCVGEVLQSGDVLDHAVRIDNVFAVWNASRVMAYVIYMPSYKHLAGRVAYVRLNEHKGSVACPVQALLHYLAARPSGGQFQFTHINQAVVTREWFVLILKVLQCLEVI